MKPNINVLITGAGGAAAVSLIRCLPQERFNLFAADCDPVAAGLFLVPASRRLTLPRGNDPEFAAAVLDVCSDLDIDVVIPTVDTELLPLAKNIVRFTCRGVSLLCTSEASLVSTLDKWTLVMTCRGSVPLPRTWLASRLPTATSEPGKVILKPRQGSGSRGVELLQSVADVPPNKRNDDWLVQEFLPGEEYSVDVLTTPEGLVVASVPRCRIKVDSGIAVAARTLHDTALEEFARRVVRATGVTFAANVQFKRRTDGTPCLLEVNPRFPGTMPITVKAGVNMPVLSLQMLLSSFRPSVGLPFQDIGVVRYWEERFVEAGELDDKPVADVHVAA